MLFKDNEARKQIEELKKAVGKRRERLFIFSFRSLLGDEPAVKVPTLFEELERVEEKIDALAAHFGVQLYTTEKQDAKVAVRKVKKNR